MKFLSFFYWLYEVLFTYLKPASSTSPVSPVTPQEPPTEELHPVPANVPAQPYTPPKSRLNEFCTYLRDFEGKPGDLNYRNNNPGNVRCSPVGYDPYYGKVLCVGGFAKFSTSALGWHYLTNIIAQRVKQHPTWTFYDFFSVWAPSDDNNDPAHYAQHIAAQMNVPPTTKLSTIL